MEKLHFQLKERQAKAEYLRRRYFFHCSKSFFVCAALRLAGLMVEFSLSFSLVIYQLTYLDQWILLIQQDSASYEV